MAKPRKGVVPPQLRPYLFKRGGATGAPRRARSPRTARAPHKPPMGLLGKAKAGLAKVGGAKTVYIAYRVGNETSIIQRARNVYNTPTLDQVAGQLQDAGKDLEARGGRIVAEGAVILLVKKGLQWVGVSVPDWV